MVTESESSRGIVIPSVNGIQFNIILRGAVSQRRGFCAYFVRIAGVGLLGLV